MNSQRLTIFADYFQVYVEDAGFKSDPVDWTDQTLSDRLIPRGEGLVFATQRNMTVPVEVEVQEEAEAEPVLQGWDHIVECGLYLPSGEVVVMGCSDYWPDAARFACPAGHYRARIYQRGLDTLSEDGLDGQDEYRVVLSPGRVEGLRVITRYQA